jgi:thiol-disulfide isomerase/thioredoxin
MKRYFCFLALLCLFLRALAQEDITARGVQTGQQVPEVMVKNVTGLVVNGRRVSDFSLSALRGKLVILDFWATWCAPCRKLVPLMDSLQMVFGDKVVFLPVTYQSNSEVGPVLNAIRILRPFHLPEVTGDTILHKLFPHRSLPHLVWIDGSGIVRAITEEKELTGDHIREILAGGASKLAAKSDLIIPYNPATPLFIGGNSLPEGALRYHSALSGYIPGLEAGMDIYPPDSVNGQRSNVRNVPLTWLIRMAYADHGHWFTPSLMRLLTADSARLRTKLSGQAYQNWLGQGNGWCYALLVPPALAARSFELMQQDVARLFPQYRIRVENTVTRCLVLVRTSATDKLRTAGGRTTVNVGPFSAELRNTRIGQLTVRLQAQYLEQLPLPVIDGTGYNYPVDLSINAPLNDVAAMNRELARYDLRFVEKDAAVDLLLVRDNDRKSHP